MSTAHEWSDQVGAYVLGALSPKDRQEYEQHLRECDACATAVRKSTSQSVGASDW